MSKAHEAAMRAAQQRVVEQRGFTIPKVSRKDFGDEIPVVSNGMAWTMVAAVAVIVIMIIIEACQ